MKMPIIGLLMGWVVGRGGVEGEVEGVCVEGWGPWGHVFLCE